VAQVFNGPDVLPVTQPSVKALKDTQSTDINQWPDLMISSPITRLLAEGVLLPQHLLFNTTTPHTHNRFTALFWDHPGEPVPEENF